MAWLDDHPPQRSQFHDPRREKPSGVIVVHTAENVMDSVGPDTGAEGVANFIRTRDTPGSYHELVDSNSTMHLVRWTCEAYQDGTGSNPHALGLSFACRTSDWSRMGATTRNGFIEHGANAAAAYVRWMKDRYGIVVPPQRISRPDSEARKPGYIGHGERDPGRRSDPGADFPWGQFLQRVSALSGATPPAPTPGPEPVTPKGAKMFLIGHESSGNWWLCDESTRRLISDDTAMYGAAHGVPTLGSVSDDAFNILAVQGRQKISSVVK